MHQHGQGHTGDIRQDNARRRHLYRADSRASEHRSAGDAQIFSGAGHGTLRSIGRTSRRLTTSLGGASQCQGSVSTQGGPHAPACGCLWHKKHVSESRRLNDVRGINDHIMKKRRFDDDELSAHFVTFSCYRRRNLLNHDRAKKIVLGCVKLYGLRRPWGSGGREKRSSSDESDRLSE